MADQPEIRRTDEVSLMRNALLELTRSTQLLDTLYNELDPVELGVMWDKMRKAYHAGISALNAVEDPTPDICAFTWFDALDNVWTRCGLPTRHVDDVRTKTHLAPWMIKDKTKKDV